MFKPATNEKGVVLLMVLGTILVVVILANVVLSIILSQSRLTHHQVSRIQAYYAAQAGMMYAFERLRVGSWTAPTVRRLCRQAAAGCEPLPAQGFGLPYDVTINILAYGTDPDGPAGQNPSFPNVAPVIVNVDYSHVD